MITIPSPVFRSWNNLVRRFLVPAILSTPMLHALGGEDLNRQKDFPKGGADNETMTAPKGWTYFWTSTQNSRKLENLNVMVWDNSWWNTNIQVWAKGDNQPPSVTEKSVTLDLNSYAVGYGVVVAWKNVSSKEVSVNVDGALTPFWSSAEGEKEPNSWPDVNFQIVVVNAAGVPEKTSFEKTFTFEADQKQATILNEKVTVPAGGSVYFTYFADDKKSAKGFVIFDDSLSLSVE